jgi:hypothetical protein
VVLVDHRGPLPAGDEQDQGLFVHVAVGSFAVIAVFLRQRGLPESKPVGAPHGATADSGDLGLRM